MKLLKEKNEEGEPGTFRKTSQLQKKVRLERYLVKTVIRMFSNSILRDVYRFS